MNSYSSNGCFICQSSLGRKCIRLESKIRHTLTLTSFKRKNGCTHLIRNWDIFLERFFFVGKTIPDPRMLCHTEGKFTAQRRPLLQGNGTWMIQVKNVCFVKNNCTIPVGKKPKNCQPINNVATQFFAKTLGRELISGMMSGQRNSANACYSD